MPNTSNKSFEGFQKISEWQLGGRAKSGIIYTAIPQEFIGKEVVYAFVVEQEIEYIGIAGNLDDRLNYYRITNNSGTNVRIRGKIKEKLEEGKQIKIFAKPITGEKTLIKDLEPQWNEQGKKGRS